MKKPWERQGSRLTPGLLRTPISFQIYPLLRILKVYSLKRFGWCSLIFFDVLRCVHLGEGHQNRSLEGVVFTCIYSATCWGTMGNSSMQFGAVRCVRKCWAGEDRERGESHEPWWTFNCSRCSLSGFLSSCPLHYECRGHFSQHWAASRLSCRQHTRNLATEDAMAFSYAEIGIVNNSKLSIGIV